MKLVTDCFKVFSVILVLLTAGPLAAQTEAEAPKEPMTAGEINSMVARMSDDEVRALLLERLDAVEESEAAEEPLGPVAQLERLWSAFTFPLRRALAVLPQVPQHQAAAFSTFVERFGGASGVFKFFGLVLLGLAIAIASELAARRFIRLKVPDAPDDAEVSIWPQLKYLGLRLLRQIMGLVVFYVALRIVGPILLTDDQLAVAAPLVISLIWMPRIFSAFFRFVLSPRQPSLRLVNVDDRTAMFLHVSLVAVIFWMGLTLYLPRFNQLNGVMTGETYIAYWMDSLVYLFLALIAWTARDGLQTIVRGNSTETTRFDEALAKTYPYLIIALAIGMWVLVTTLIGLGNTESLFRGAHYTTLACFIIAPIADTAVRGLVARLVPPLRGEGALAEAAHMATKRSYIRLGRVVVVGALLVEVSSAWGYSLVGLLNDRPGIGDNFFRFLLTLVIGYIVAEGFSLWVNQRLEQEKTGAGPKLEEEELGPGGSRLSTVLPLALAAARVSIAVIFGLLAIGNLGIDVTPLLAGFGVAGLAIGFGAQKLVTDVVSGVFFLLDDAFRIGEYVEIDGTMGTVERISVRSMTLRHHRGALHTIPYGEIPKLTNFSRDWVIMKLKFTVDFETDPNKVKKIFKKIGAELMEDPLYKDDFLEPFKSQGVLDFDDIGMVIRGKFMTRPGKQFTIRKEIYNRVKALFEENDIHFARREVRVALPEGTDVQKLSEEDKEQIAKAAATNAS